LTGSTTVPMMSPRSSNPIAIRSIDVSVAACVVTHVVPSRPDVTPTRNDLNGVTRCASESRISSAENPPHALWLAMKLSMSV